MGMLEKLTKRNTIQRQKEGGADRHGTTARQQEDPGAARLGSTYFSWQFMTYFALFFAATLFPYLLVENCSVSLCLRLSLFVLQYPFHCLARRNVSFVVSHRGRKKRFI